ncbi:MAG TPA: hypothetical protein VNA15_04855 [Candidatus Angelobacter sp.]|nr:hypothetical protein [Candidatus Angelobacter sp.]
MSERRQQFTLPPKKSSIPKGPIVFSRRRFYVLVSPLLILIIIVPITIYWAEQRIAEHARWGNEINYAFLFRMNVGSAAEFINGTFYPWNNESQRSAQTLLSQGETTLLLLEGLDTAHAIQLDNIANKVHLVPSAFNQITQSRRVSLSTNLEALGEKIVNAYILNNTSTTNGVGPSLWYSGPSSPNEQNLQDATTIAANLTG